MLLIYINMDCCSICLEELSNNTTTTSCNHCFHETCLNTWTERNTTCPLCRHHMLYYEVDLPEYLCGPEVDVLDNNTNRWYQGIVIDIIEDIIEPIIRIRYNNYQEWIPMNSTRIAVLGRHTTTRTGFIIFNDEFDEIYRNSRRFSIWSPPPFELNPSMNIDSEGNYYPELRERVFNLETHQTRVNNFHTFVNNPNMTLMDLLHRFEIEN